MAKLKLIGILEIENVELQIKGYPEDLRKFLDAGAKIEAPFWNGIKEAVDYAIKNPPPECNCDNQE